MTALRGASFLGAYFVFVLTWLTAYDEANYNK
jgi:hypothetical protein